MNDANLVSFEKFSIRAVLGLLILAAVLLHVRLLARMDFDGENSRTEADALYALRSISTGGPLYYNFSHPPHVLAQYTPAFYLVPAMLARTFGVEPSRTFLVGRWYTYVCWLGIAGLLYALARRDGGTALAGVFAAALWLASGLAPEWANSYRPDAPAVFFSLAAIWLYLSSKQSAMALAGVSLLLIAATLHKQSTVVAAGMIVIEECRQRRVGRALTVATVWLAGCAVGMFATQIWSQGAFAGNVFGSLLRTDLKAAPLLAVLAIARGAPAFVGGMVSPRSGFLKHYCIAAFAFATVTAIKTGSNLNYFLESFAIACVLTASVATQPVERPKSCLIWLGVAIASVLLTLTNRVSGIPHWKAEVVDHGNARAHQAQKWDTLRTKLDQWPDPILIEDTYLAYRLGRAPFMLNLANFTTMNSPKLFDEHAFLQRAIAGEFTAVVTQEPLEQEDRERPLPTSWREAILTRYTLAEQFDSTTFVYRSHPQ